jgi:hypothetical protein
MKNYRDRGQAHLQKYRKSFVPSLFAGEYCSGFRWRELADTYKQQILRPFVEKLRT